MISGHTGQGGIERARELAAKIAVEKDHDKFTALVAELNRLLEGDGPSPDSLPQSTPPIRD
jgi:hypothetical protein